MGIGFLQIFTNTITNMRLLFDRVLVEPIVEHTSKSGLILPDSSKKKNTGKVVLIGEKVRTIAVGDVVKFHENEGISIEYHGKDCLIFSEENHIIAVYN